VPRRLSDVKTIPAHPALRGARRGRLLSRRGRDRAGRHGHPRARGPTAYPTGSSTGREPAVGLLPSAAARHEGSHAASPAPARIGHVRVFFPLGSARGAPPLRRGAPPGCG